MSKEYIRREPGHKTRPCKSLTAYQAWKKAHRICAACGREDGECLFGISAHHIVKAGRAHEACNLLALCVSPCHDLAEGLDVRGPSRVEWHDDGIHEKFGALLPKLSLGICLSLKMLRDPAEVDMKRLEELRGARLPDPEEIPPYFIELFNKRRGRPC